MSELCYKCFKPKNSCLCKYGKELDTGIKFVFLMHPKEAKRNRTGTGYLSRMCLKDSEVIIGLEYAQNPRLQQLLNDPQYFPVLMYPGEEAWTAKKEGFAQAIGDKILLVLILDATWFCSRKMIEHNQFLLELPRVSFFGDYRSIFTFKKEPRPEYISTIECCYYFIKELQTIDMIDKNLNPEPLMDVFKAMIKFQINAENERMLGLRPNTHSYDSKYTHLKKMPDFD